MKSLKAFTEEAMGESKEPAVAKIGPELSDTQRMMYAFGDSRRPKAETAKVLETVVLSQISGIVTQVIASVLIRFCPQPGFQMLNSSFLFQLRLSLFQAAKVAASRGSKTLGLEDLLFLMRHSPVKVKQKKDLK